MSSATLDSRYPKKFRVNTRSPVIAHQVINGNAVKGFVVTFEGARIYYSTREFHEHFEPQLEESGA